MKTKVGNKIFPIVYFATIGYVVYSAVKNNTKANIVSSSQPDKIQYANRLIEFFETDSIQDVYKKYQEYVDFGISAKDAFLMLTEDEK